MVFACADCFSEREEEKRLLITVWHPQEKALCTNIKNLLKSKSHSGKILRKPLQKHKEKSRAKEKMSNETLKDDQNEGDSHDVYFVFF